MIKKKKIGILLGALTIFNLTIKTCFANEELVLGKYTMEEAAELSGFTVEDLTAYKEISKENFDKEVERFIESSSKTIDINNLETLGGSSKSVIRNNKGCENHNTYSLVRVKGSVLNNTQISNAVKYGKSNLTGIKYNASSGWGSPYSVNCASLVMKAYKYGANFTFTNSYPTATSLPREFIDSKHTFEQYSYNMPW